MVPRLFKNALNRFVDNDMLSYSAAITYHVLFSALPFLIFLISLLGFLELSSVFDWLRQRSESYFLEDTIPQINLILDQLQRRRVGMLSFGALASLWASSSALRSMMRAMNAVYGVKEGRPLWRRYAISIAWTLPLGLLFAAVVSMVVVSPDAMRVLAQWLGVERGFAVLWAWWLRWPAAIALLAVIVAIVYAITPDAEQRVRFVSPGAIAVVVAWSAASTAFNYYVRHIAGYDRLYGSVGTAIVLPLYVYCTAVIFLFGAQLNAVTEHQSASGKNVGEKEVHEA